MEQAGIKIFNVEDIPQGGVRDIHAEVGQLAVFAQGLIERLPEGVADHQLPEVPAGEDLAVFGGGIHQSDDLVGLGRELFLDPPVVQRFQHLGGQKPEQPQ